MITSLLRNLSSYFSRWRHKALEVCLVDTVEATGHTAQAVAKAGRRHDSIKQLLKDQGMKHTKKSTFILMPMKNRPEEKGKEAGQQRDQDTAREPEERKPWRQRSSLFLKPVELRNTLAERKELVALFTNKWLRRAEGYDLISRCLGRWQNWLATRRAAEYYSHFVRTRLQFRDKAWAFHRLRHQRRAARKAFEHVARADIIQR